MLENAATRPLSVGNQPSVVVPRTAHLGFLNASNWTCPEFRTQATSIWNITRSPTFPWRRVLVVLHTFNQITQVGFLKFPSEGRHNKFSWEGSHSSSSMRVFYHITLAVGKAYISNMMRAFGFNRVNIHSIITQCLRQTSVHACPKWFPNHSLITWQEHLWCHWSHH